MPSRSSPCTMPLSITEQLEAIYEAESRRVLATLIRLVMFTDVAADLQVRPIQNVAS